MLPTVAVHVTPTFAENCCVPNFGRLAEVGETVTTVAGATAARSGAFVSPPALSCTLKFPEYEPAAADVKATLKVQEAPPAIVPPQVFVLMENCDAPAVIDCVEMVTVPVPMFEIVNCLFTVVEMVTVP
jgi:hypothetical protein